MHALAAASARLIPMKVPKGWLRVPRDQHPGVTEDWTDEDREGVRRLWTRAGSYIAFLIVGAIVRGCLGK
jgi:hypothetical protein